jgi:hypothetical protein
MKFKVGDQVTLSEKGVDEFSKNGWGDYSVPLALYQGNYGTVDTIENPDGEPHYYVRNCEGRVYFHEDQITLVNIVQTDIKEEYTGSSSNYYKVFVKHPTTLPEPYEAECNDVIESLQMTFAEGNAFKAIWRKAKARQGVKKKGYDNGVYDSEKVVFFGERMLIEAKDNESI